MRQPRMHRQGENLFPMFRNSAQWIERIQIFQKRFCLNDPRLRRKIHPFQRRDRVRTHPPVRKFQQKRSKIGFEDLRDIEIRQTVLLIHAPETIADTRSGTPRPAPPLIRRGFGNPHCLQTVHAASRRKTGNAHQPAVDHDTHIFNRQTRLRNGGGEDHFPAAFRIGIYRGILQFLRQISIERRDRDIFRKVFQQSRGPADLPLSRQEHKNIALIRAERRTDRQSYIMLDR